MHDGQGEKNTVRWSGKNTVWLIAGSVFLLVIGIFLFRFLPKRHPESDYLTQSTAAIANKPNQPLSHAVVETNDIPSDDRPVSLTRELLFSQPGYITGKRAWDCLAELKALGMQAKGIIDTLASSTNVNERLLGVFLALEVFGPTNSVLEIAAHDPEPVIPAEVGQWLYLNNRFDQWDSFLNNYATNQQPSQMESLLGLCDRVPVVADVPTGMSILTIGRGLPLLLQEMARRSDSMALEMSHRILDPSVADNNRLSLLNVMQDARPAGFAAILTNLISQSTQYSPLRFKAVWNLGEICGDEQTLMFLKLQASNTEDGLSVKITEAAAKAEKRMRAGNAQFRLLERDAEKILMTGDLSQKDTATALLRLYVETAIRESGVSPNPKLLLAAKEEFEGKKPLTFQQRQRLADIDYLLWRSTHTNAIGRGTL